MRIPVSLFCPASFLLLLVVLGSGVSPAQDVPTIISEGPPEQGRVPLDLEELWRVGGEDGELIFGRILDVLADPAGNILVLDNQLCQVVVLSPEGEHLRDLGGPGEGPGELQQPMGIALLGDDLLGVGMGYPGKVVTLRLDGTPVGSLYPMGEPAEGYIAIMMNLQAADGLMLASGGKLNFLGANDASTRRFMAIAAKPYAETTVLLEASMPLDPSGLRFDEAADYYPDRNWALGPGGTIYAPMERDRYAISVYDREGRLERVFGRELAPRQRTKAEMEDLRPVINVNNQPDHSGWKFEDTDPSIGRLMYNFDEGTLWVMTPNGNEDQPDGILQTWDVFSPEGRYLREVPVPLGHAMREGTCYLVGGDRLVVVRGTGTSFGSGGEDDPEEDPEPLEVICYRVG